MRRILVINANPKPQSLGKAMALRYAEQASIKHQVEVLHLSDMEFQLDLNLGYDQSLPLEADLQRFQEQLSWAEHIVIISPVWWGSMPAKLKGLFDRTLLPGFAFKFHKGKSMPEKLLKGRTSELIITLDTPTYWYKWVQGNPIYHQFKRTILDFIGVKNKAIHYFGPVMNSDQPTRERWLKEVERLAA